MIYELTLTARPLGNLDFPKQSQRWVSPHRFTGSAIAQNIKEMSKEVREKFSLPDDDKYRIKVTYEITTTGDI